MKTILLIALLIGWHCYCTCGWCRECMFRGEGNKYQGNGVYRGKDNSYRGGGYQAGHGFVRERSSWSGMGK